VWSTDGGVNWNPGGPTQIQSQEAYLSNLTYTSYGGGRFIVVYSKDEPAPVRIWSTYSTDGGANWSTPIVVENYYTENSRDFPAVAANSEGYVMCVWQYPPVGALSSNRSFDGGDSWQSNTEQLFSSTYPANDVNVSRWQSLTYDPCNVSFLCTWASKPNGQTWYDIYASEYLLGFPYWPSPVQITNHLRSADSHGPRISSYSSVFGRNRYITFANGNNPSALSIWESKSGCIFGGGGQSKEIVQRDEEKISFVKVSPNPAREVVKIGYSLGDKEKTGTLKVYSITGQLVKNLSLNGGTGNLSWNMRDEAGRPVANGVYLLRLDASGLNLSERLVVIR